MSAPPACVEESIDFSLTVLGSVRLKPMYSIFITVYICNERQDIIIIVVQLLNWDKLERAHINQYYEKTGTAVLLRHPRVR